jgi:hypothetical protein
MVALAMVAPKLISSPYHPLHGFRLKLNRAQAHAEALHAEIDAWFRRHPYEVFGEYNPGPPEQYVFKARFLEAVPPEWGIILGDFAHNARSALDHLAYQVVMHGSGGVHVERTQFPIVLSPFAWTERSKSLEGATERHIEIVESFQPYHRPDLYGWHTVWAGIEDPLAILNRLSNVDKHIVLNATPATIQSIGWDTSIVRDVEAVGGSEAPMGILLDEGEVVRVNITASGPNPELRLERRETLEIQVQHRISLSPASYTLWSVPLKESLDEILDRLRQIFRIFVGEFR